MTRSLTEYLAAWLGRQRAQGISDHLLKTAQYYLLDWLGSALAGRATEPGRILGMYGSETGDGRCHIIGAHSRCPAETAALINGGLSHIVEMDDLDRGSVVHPAAVIMPAALAVAEREGATGREFLSAIVVGYEIAIRIGEAVGKRHYFYFHNTATCGVFGAAAAAGWLLGLNAQQLIWAWGNAGTQAAGLWQFNHDGDMSKHLHAGMAAANGIRAADLAKFGFSGARHILEGERGFFAAMAPDARQESVIAGLDRQTYKIESVSIKPHASCRHTHPAVDAAIALRAQLANREIVSCQIDTYQAALDLCDNRAPHTPYAAKFSLQYCVAAALMRGQAGLSEFTETAIADIETRSLLEKINVTLHAGFEMHYPAQWSASVSLVLNDGTELRKTVLHPKGDPENPLNRAELTAKFHRLAAYGGYADAGDVWLQWLDGLLSDQTLAFPVPRLEQL